MANIRGVLKINENGATLTSYTSNPRTNNLSKVPQTTNILSFVRNLSINDKNFRGARGTPIGITKISDMKFGVYDENNNFMEQYNGLDFGYTNEYGVLNLTITIRGNNVINFKIYFDKLRGQYPTDYTWYDIDNVAHTITGNTSTELSFSQRAGTGTTRIVFSQWALPNTSVGITYVENVEINVSMNKQWVVNYETQSQKTNDASQLIFGVMPSTGAIKLKDIDNKLYNNASLGYLDMDLFELTMYINVEKVQEHISNDSPFYSSDNTLDLQLSDFLSTFDKITVPSLSYTTSNSLYDYLKDLLNYYRTDYIDTVRFKNIVAFGSLNPIWRTTKSLKDILRDSKFKSNVTFSSGTLLEKLNDFCTGIFLNMYIDNYGFLIIDDAVPRLDSIKNSEYDLNKIIDIPYNKQINKLEYDLLVDNKYTSVTIKNN